MGCQLLASNVQQDLDLTNVRPKTSCCLFLFLIRLYDLKKIVFRYMEHIYKERRKSPCQTGVAAI